MVTRKEQCQNHKSAKLTHEPEHTAVQEPPTIPLEDMLNEAICKIELECVEMSAELPSHAIEGKDSQPAGQAD